MISLFPVPLADATPLLAGTEILQLRVPTSSSVTLKLGGVKSVGKLSSDIITVAVLPLITGGVQVLVMKFPVTKVLLPPPLDDLAR
jgi:hypothetical protein